MIGRIQEQKFSQNLVSAPLSVIQDYTEDGTLIGVYLGASVAITETVTITKVSRFGSVYNHVLKTADLNGDQYVRFCPADEKIVIKKGDSVKVQCTNANTTGVVYGIIQFEGGVNE